jgi:transitional endoplasmic reticulum ATPase
MNDFVDTPELFIGTLSKVVSVNPDDDAFHFRTQDGSTGRMGNLNALPDVGEVILVRSNGWFPADPNAWTASYSVGVVRQIVDGERVLLDTPLGLRTVTNLGHLNLLSGNTVEYNDFEGVVRIISDQPIRPKRFEDETTSAKDYLVPAQDGPGLTFADFGGYRHVVQRAQELIDTQFRRRKYLDKIGARPLRGVLFSGPPGTGKTHLARIIAHEAEADFYLISGPSIVSKWLGETEDILRKIFEAARDSANGRAIIFFDEIDSIAERRSGDTHEASKRLVAQLLTLMDGFDDGGVGSS